MLGTTGGGDWLGFNCDPSRSPRRRRHAPGVLRLYRDVCPGGFVAALRMCAVDVDGRNAC
eukprot:357778-Chlamydomonas_euryale.AAC.5